MRLFVDATLSWVAVGFTILLVNLLFSRDGLVRIGILPAGTKPSLLNKVGFLALGLAGPVLLQNPYFRMGFRVLIGLIRLRVTRWWRNRFRH